MIARKSNVKADQEAKVLTELRPETTFAYVLKAAGAARSAALTFCYSVTAYMLNVNHLQPKDSDLFMSKDAAQKYIKEQIDKQANVKGRMLDHYVSTGVALYDKLIGPGGKPTSLGAPIVKLMAEAANKEEDIAEVVDALDNLVGKNTKVQSFRDLSVQMGFKSFAPRETGTKEKTANDAIKQLTNAITSVEKNRAEGKIKGGLTETKVVETVAMTVSDPINLARAALERLAKVDVTSDDALDRILDLVKLAQKVADAAEAAWEAREKAAKAEKKAKKGKAIPKIAAKAKTAKRPSVSI